MENTLRLENFQFKCTINQMRKVDFQNVHSLQPVSTHKFCKTTVMVYVEDDFIKIYAKSFS